MKRDCSTCICKEGSCYPSTTIFDKDKTCKSYDPDYEGYIAELEKENAELKGLVNQYKASKCGSISLVNRNMIMFDQLTKAKEYIKLLLMNCVGVYESTGKTIAEIQAEAEQFLNGE